MPVRRSSPAVLAYVALAIVQLVMVLIIGGGGISVPGVILAVALFGYLYVGKPLAWWLLVTMNSIGLVATLIVVGSHLFGGGHLLWANVLVLLVTTAAMEAALLSPPMRRHIASRGLRLTARKS
jgi:hypothetical protein